MTVMRNGRMMMSRMAEVDELDLISEMLGRDLETVRAHATGFSAASEKAGSKCSRLRDSKSDAKSAARAWRPARARPWASRASSALDGGRSRPRLRLRSTGRRNDPPHGAQN